MSRLNPWDPQHCVNDFGVLRSVPCLRIPDVLPAEIADALRTELQQGLEYERIELGDLTRLWRAVRPLGDVYFGPMRRRHGWTTPTSVVDALAWFESMTFVSWLSHLAGEQLVFLRPPTAYKMEWGDKIALHDDMSDPDHAVAIAYNLSQGWKSWWGGETAYGKVTSVVPVETPPDSPIDLMHWEIANEAYFTPIFNSLLVMTLSPHFAHGVTTCMGPTDRLSLVGIYGRCGTVTTTNNPEAGG